jgi:hypothetical protein
VKLPWTQAAKAAFIGVPASTDAHASNVRLAPQWGILESRSASIAVVCGILSLMLVSEPEDCSRFNILTGMLPKRIAERVNAALMLAIRRGSANATRTNIQEGRAVRRQAWTQSGERQEGSFHCARVSAKLGSRGRRI